MFQTFAILSLCFATALGLDHEKSFLLKDAAATISSIATYKNSILLTAVVDVVQKDIDTGALQRTFKAHGSVVKSIIVFNGSRMVTASWDDTVILWDLDTGSILKRIPLGASNTVVTKASYLNNQLFTGGYDNKIRQIDLVTGKVLKVVDHGTMVDGVIAQDEYLYMSKFETPGKIYKYPLSDWGLLLRFEGQADYITAYTLYENLLITASGQAFIFVYDKQTGLKTGEFYGYTDTVYHMVGINGFLYVGGYLGTLASWKIDDGFNIKRFPQHHQSAVNTLYLTNATGYSGSGDATAVRWNLTTGSAIFKYRSSISRTRNAVMWKSVVISGSEDAQIRLLDTSLNSMLPFATFIEHSAMITVLHVRESMLFSGSVDTTVREWSLTELVRTRILYGHSRSVNSLSSDESYLYSGGYDFVVRKWDLATGAQIGLYSGHVDVVTAIQVGSDYIISGAFDTSAKTWNTSTTELVRTTQVFDNVNVLLAIGDFIIVGGIRSASMIQISTGNLVISLIETASCYCLAYTESRLYSGHGDNLIRGRDLTSLAIIEIYSGHQDSVIHLSLDENNVLYSSSLDGATKRWNMATRRVAFSFENRNGSVTALAAVDDILFVGTRIGTMNAFSIHNASVISVYQYHQDAVSSIISQNGSIFSCGRDGIINAVELGEESSFRVVYDSLLNPLEGLALSDQFLISIKGYRDIVLISTNTSADTIKSIISIEPLKSIAVWSNTVLAGSKSGAVFGWDTTTQNIVFELKRHTFQINFLLVDEDTLYSASEDKTIIQWSLKAESLIRILQRFSASALGHLGPVNSLSICRGTLFSVGSDLTTRRWNTVTGKHEDVYFGATKAFTSVLCYNGSVFAGSDDFSVLMYNPVLPVALETQTELGTPTNIKTRKQIKAVKKQMTSSIEALYPQTLIYVLVPSVAILIITIAFIGYRVAKTKKVSTPVTTATGAVTEVNTDVTDLQTVINSVIGISKHAAYLVPFSAVATVNLVAIGGGGKIYTAKVMDPVLRKRSPEIVIQKIVETRNKSQEEAFYQEVGIMIMLSSFPYFCEIVGYTERPLSLILKYYPDGSLYGWLKKVRISKRFKGKMLKEIAQALRIMHSHYLAHCDLKSQNVLIETVDGIPTCFLTDFGITQVLSDQIVASKMFNVINLRGLSVNYASPEAFNNFKSKNFKNADFKKYDVYSFACVMLEVLESKAPWS